MNPIIHVTSKNLWESQKNKPYYQSPSLKEEGFIHASPVHYFWRVAPNFKKVEEAMVILLLDESKIESEVRYEGFEPHGRTYPHIYGCINTSCVLGVLPYLKDEEGNWIKNEEFDAIPNI